MSKRLRCGAPRMFRSHAGIRGRWFADHYAALDEKHGPFDRMTREFAGSVAALYVAWRVDTREAEEVDRQRREGKGRRPSAQMVNRAKKRAALSWGSYAAALAKLESMANERPTTESPADMLIRSLRTGAQ